MVRFFHLYPSPLRTEPKVTGSKMQVRILSDGPSLRLVSANKIFLVQFQKAPPFMGLMTMVVNIE